jgi:hypothetical protein
MSLARRDDHVRGGRPHRPSGNRFVLGIGFLTLLSFVLGYGWAAGWLGEPGAVEASTAHCLLGGGTLGISAALGVWMLS